MTLTADSTHARGLMILDGRLIGSGLEVHDAPPAVVRRAGTRRRRVALTRRMLVLLAVCWMSWLGASGSAQAAVGVPVSIDSFGNPQLPAGPFTRTVIPLPLPHTSTTPQGTFSQSNGLGSMHMSGLGNGTSGITLEYTPAAGGSVDLTGGGSNGQIFIDFASIASDQGIGVTTYMTATDASGNVATSPSDAVGDVFAFNAAFPFSGFQGPIDFTKITKLDVSFVYPETNTGVGNLDVGVNRLWASPISGAQPSPPSPMVTAPATAIGGAGAVVDFTVSFGSDEGAAPVTYGPPSNIGVRAQDLAVAGTAFGGATPKVSVSGGPSSYTVAVSGMTQSGGITVHAPAGIVDDAWAQLNTASTNDPAVAFTFAIPPKFQSANNATFTVGSSTTFTADANGGQPAPVPTPALSISSGSLPSGLTFQDNGNGTASIAGKAAAGTGGVVPLTLQATNFAGSVTQPFTLTILEAPTISSAAAATFTVGSAGSFNITTTHDYPLPHVLIPSGSLPAGVSFKDNLNGTATISGTPAAGAGGTYTFTITADNGVAPNGVQSFTLTILEAPAISSAAAATFTVGSAGSFNITTAHDYPAATTLSIPSGSLPAGVKFTDNGTASIAGTPAAGTGGSYTFNVTATNGTAPNAVQPFTLTINEPPTVTSGAAATFTAGSAGSFTVTTGHHYPAATTLSSPAGSLPSGVAFKDNGNGTATISGTPTAGTGGSYTFNVTATNGTAPNAVQQFTLTVNEPSTSSSLTIVPPLSSAPTSSATPSSTPTSAPTTNSPPIISRTTMAGAKLSVTLNEAARVTLTFTKRVGGRKVKRECLAQTRRNHHQRTCTRTVTVGTSTFNGHTGPNRVALNTLLIHGRRLSPGRYTLIITATNPATDKQSQPQRLTLTIVR